MDKARISIKKCQTEESQGRLKEGRSRKGKI